MADIPVKNHGKNDMYRGGKLIPSGETRMVDESLVRGRSNPGAAAPVAEDVPSILVLLDQSVPNFAADIQDRDLYGKPVITDSELDRLEQAEQNGNTRKGVLEAIANERMARAEAVLAAEELADYRASIVEMDEDSLVEELETQKDDPARLAIVNDVIAAKGDAE